MKKQTIVLISLFAVVVALVAAGQLYFTNHSKVELPSTKSGESFVVENVSPLPTKQQTVNEVTVQIDFGDGTKLSEKATAKNVYEALKEAGVKKGIQVSAKEYKYGLMVEKIGNFANSKESYWMYSVNGKPGQIAADRYQVNPGDSVDWVYKK